MNGWLANGLGVLAGLLSTASFVPQVVKAWREPDTHAISLPMYLTTVTAFALWIGYGVAIASVPLIIFNALSLASSGAILLIKIKNRSKGRDES